MKILFIHHGNAKAGATLSLLGLMQGLSKLGVDCIMACHDVEAREFYSQYGFMTENVNVTLYPHTCGAWYPFWNVRGMLRLLRWWSIFPSASRDLQNLIKRIQPDIVHLNSLTLAPYLPIISAMKVRAVLHVRERLHTGTFGIRSNWLRGIVKEHASHIICICRDNLDALIPNDSKASVVYNPVDLSIFNPNNDCSDLNKELGISAHKPILLFVGGSDVIIKGIHILTAALGRLKRRNVNCTCLFVGMQMESSNSLWPTIRRAVANLLCIYSARQKFQRKVKKLDIEDMVLPRPFVRNIEQYYALADIVVIPFIKPHFARQVIEAGAMAKPVVASRIGGIEEVVHSSKTGLLVEPGNPAMLAAAIETLLLDPSLSKRMGEAGQAIAIEKYDAAISAKQVYDIYRTLF
ncbi:MAG: glycosyltransferase family 4 protein [Paludibacter sp.]|nr:glycosyltransferase family 4 protein [Paludibacter sp.]MDD4072534.1 glycosyltransferase family 4 protein [Desulfobacterales bacterium]MDD4428538.1 glycosyltransferase family 4 protein [Paludibacter sp.]